MDTFVAHYPDLGLHLALLHMLTFDCDIKTGAVDTINLYVKKWGRYDELIFVSD